MDHKLLLPISEQTGLHIDISQQNSLLVSHTVFSSEIERKR